MMIFEQWKERNEITDNNHPVISSKPLLALKIKFNNYMNKLGDFFASAKQVILKRAQSIY